MYQYLTDFHGKSQFFMVFALRSMWLVFSLMLNFSGGLVYYNILHTILVRR